MGPDELLDKNLKAFGPAIGEKRLAELDWDYINTKLSSSSFEDDFKNWHASPDKAIIMPDIMPRSRELMEYYLKLSEQYTLGEPVEQYYNDHECDPHLFDFLNVAFEAIGEVGEDCSVNVTTDQFDVHNLIVVDTGDGDFLNHMIQKYNPKNLIIAVPKWEDFVSSFYKTDWIALHSQYSQEKQQNPCRIGLHLSRIDSSNQILHMLLKNDIASMDHSLLCFSANSSDNAQTLVKGLNSKTAQNIVNYLGFTQDEYNMVKTSTTKMQHGCKIYTPVPENVRFTKVVVCASGPSLDQSLPKLKSLMETHFIIASASCYGTLRDYGIRVDAVIILERGYSVYEDYLSVIQKNGRDNAMLITSSVSDIRLHSLFEKTVTYFRVSLTPFALFSQKYNEHLPFDGPQAVNSAVSFALGFRPKSLILVGVDLGTRDLSNVRSKGAVGVSPRTLDLEKTANLALDDIAYTDTYMTDASIILHELAKIFEKDVPLYNSSDGILIDGYQPTQLDDYVALDSKSPSDISLDETYATLNRWYQSCRKSDSEDFYATWHRGGQRTSIHKTFSDFRFVLTQGKGRLNENEYHKINKIFAVDRPQRDQFAPRITRGCMIKLTAALKRQDILLTSKPTERDQYFDIIRKKLIPLTYLLEKELYSLVSDVEKDFLFKESDINKARPLS